MELKELKKASDGFSKSSIMPVYFLGHGNPMNAIYNNAFTQRLEVLGKDLNELHPNAILVISAHWLTNGTQVMASEHPKTIHDFYGFPEELFRQQYPAPGAPVLAKEVTQMVTSTTVEESLDWGLDHGTWSLLIHMFPQANIPVFQLSINAAKPAAWHYQLAAELATLRQKGVLIIASGNIVHNLHSVSFAENPQPYGWAIEFDELVKNKLLTRQYSDLLNYAQLGKAAQLSIPTNDHYLPMMYALGVTQKVEELKFVYEKIQNASISMRCFQIG